LLGLKKRLESMGFESISPIDPSKKVERIGEDKQGREKKSSEQFRPSSKSLWSLCYFTYKELSSFLPHSSNQASIVLIKESLKGLQKNFQMLTEQDLSQNTIFLAHLSSCWNRFLDSFIPFSLIQDPLIMQTHNFIQEIKTYPKGAEYSLGYYLSEFAGQSWIPFPYMEILKKLYDLSQEHSEETPTLENNPLKKWILDIESLLQLD
jgi:hypothetical protein